MAVHLKPEETRGYHSPESLGLVYCSAERVEIAGTELLKSCLLYTSGSRRLPPVRKNITRRPENG